jgi:hypothetical protein
LCSLLHGSNTLHFRFPSPTEKLHITSTNTHALIEGGGDKVGIDLFFTGAAGRRYEIASTGAGAGGAGRLKITDKTLSVDRFTIDPVGNVFLGDESSPTLLAMDNGNVGIGHSNPPNILTVVQSSPTDPIADAWTVYSSRRWKTDIKTIDRALDKVMDLRGVSYKWKTDGKPDIGLIAEEVGEVIPEIVAFEENGSDAKSVDYQRIVALLIEATKEQQKTIDELQAEVNNLKTRIQ